MFAWGPLAAVEGKGLKSDTMAVLFPLQVIISYGFK